MQQLHGNSGPAASPEAGLNMGGRRRRPRPGGKASSLSLVPDSFQAETLASDHEDHEASAFPSLADRLLDILRREGIRLEEKQLRRLQEEARQQLQDEARGARQEKEQQLLRRREDAKHR